MIDVLVAKFVAFVTTVCILSLMGILSRDMSPSAFIYTILLQMVPGSFGALLAQSEISTENREDADELEKKEKEGTGYLGELFLMATGALFLSFSIAPTEEVVLIAHRMSRLQGVLMILVSVLILHAFVYSLAFKGSHEKPENHGNRNVFFKFTLVGYAIALAISAFVLWTFHRNDGLALSEYMHLVAVLAFPATVGAASARLIF